MIQIIIKETKDFLRDTSNIFFFLIFPVILVFLLGNLLSPTDNAEDTIGEIKIHYTIDTEEIADTLAIKGFVSGIDDNENIIFERTKDLENSIMLAGNDDIAATVQFINNPLEIHIYEGTDRIKNRTVKAMMNGFVQVNKAVNIIVENNPLSLNRLGNTDYEYIEEKDLGVKRTMLDYYAITMMSMLSFMSFMLGSMCFMGEKENGTIHRLKIAPINQVKLFFSKILGLLPQTILQISIMMIVNVFVFGANYASNITHNIYLFLYFFIVTFAIISIGAVYGLYIDINPMASFFPLIWLMMFFGGTYSKEVFIDGLTQAMPIYQVQEAAFDIAIFGRYTKANTIIIISIVITIVMLILGGLFFSRKEKK